MNHRLFFCVLALALAACASVPANRSPQSVGPATATGIPVDNAWKRQVYEYAQKNVVHPSWGIAHSERDYQLTKVLAAKEGIALDEDVLFASAFLHDLGGIGSFAVKGVDHGVRSAQLMEPLLREWGFPMEKWPLVKEMVIGHVYYAPASGSPAAKAFRDADILDFLGALGAARILAVTEEPGRASNTLEPIVDGIRNFSRSLPEKCTYASCRELAGPRVVEMQNFLDQVNKEDFSGQAL
jgi:uncharacterized protein